MDIETSRQRHLMAVTSSFACKLPPVKSILVSGDFGSKHIYWSRVDTLQPLGILPCEFLLVA